MSDAPPIRVGTRASPLAQWQATWVADALRSRGHQAVLAPITTRGDADRQTPVAALGTRGVFTNELQRALLDGRIDVAVHSLKDLPTEPTAGIALIAVPPRESPHDVFVSRDNSPFTALPRGARIGTGSPRRQTQLWHVRDDLQMVALRGNVDTRLRKLMEGECEALILAEAGLKRLGLADRICEVFPARLMMPAVGQGALGFEIRVDDVSTSAALTPLDDAPTHAAVLAERSLLHSVGGGCLAPVGAWARFADDQLELEGLVMSHDGRTRVLAQGFAPAVEAVALGADVARQLLEQGAAALIEAARTGSAK